MYYVYGNSYNLSNCIFFLDVGFAPKRRLGSFYKNFNKCDLISLIFLSYCN